ncbi:ABC transporter ATP-binding protein/permease [Rhodovarius crocodyli]|uniref:ABC transporter ATP-binding protein/permease n=1 Tax=Rhodovarius crocodyli TaxID=1979269 RepID=A0A437MME5_9PROT|nr:ABC transporter ATP-binding protein/permease [Rhodovarius crocodyli]RVT98809.1 ABC transporter ATP-binding protein/permease [Rhodovarius crocodyli]
MIKVLKDAAALAAPYFKGEDKVRGWLLLLAVVALNLTLVGASVLLSYWNREFFNVLQARDAEAFWQLLFSWRTTEGGTMPGFVGIAVIYILIAVYQLYLRQALQIRWRAWMTEKQMARWLADRAYYRIALTMPGTDNPDQRIAEDIRLFVDTTLTLGLGLMRSVVSLFSFILVLWALSGPLEVWGISIPGYMVWVALAYAVVGTWFAHLIGRRLVRLNFTQQKVEADFRFALMRLRENVEAVALSAGERDEHASLLTRFRALIGNWWEIMVATKRLTFFTAGYTQVAIVFPIVVASPGYFAGRMQLGELTQTSGAFGEVQGALSWIVDNYSNLTEWGATVERLTTFSRAIDEAAAAEATGVRSLHEGGALELRDLSISLPGGRVLLEPTDLTINPGEHVLLAGASGSGKSTLLRAIAGIWPFGTGSAALPKGARAMFLPQRAYLPLGTLRHALCYPTAEAGCDEAELLRVLEAVGLGHLRDRLDAEDAWAQRLSGGEQQRVALARALLQKPDWLFLDEATASLDPESEGHLYRLLKQELPGTTVVSIAHRESLAQYHERRIRLAERRLAES